MALVTPAPHRYARLSTNDMYVYVSIALVMCFAYGVATYKLPALILLATCVGTCVLLELLISSIKNHKVMFQDASCFVTGLTLACVMPIGMPWYVGISAAAISVALKYLFGGLGNNLFNPSALGRSIVGCLFSGFAFDWFGQSSTVLQTVLSGDKSSLIIENMLVGNVDGAVGTICVLMILICAIVLVVLRIIRWENVLFALVGFISMVWLLMGADFIIPMLMSGSFIFVSVFMLSDPTTSPYGFSARSVYAAIFGILAAIMMRFNVLGETSVFLALLIANLLAPALDSVFSVFKKGVKGNG